MAKFLLRRFANYVILAAVATSGAYMLAAAASSRARTSRDATRRRRRRSSTPALHRAQPQRQDAGPRALQDVGQRGRATRLRQDVGWRLGQRRDGPAHRRQPPPPAHRDDHRAALLGVARRRLRGHPPVPTLRPRGHDAVVRDPLDPGRSSWRCVLEIAAVGFNNAVGHRGASSTPASSRRACRAASAPTRSTGSQHLVLPTHHADPRRDRDLQPLPAQRDARRAGHRLRPHRPGQGAARGAAR